MTARPPEPNFIYVGAPKSGSTWLFKALQEHPDVFVTPEKSTGFFETDTPGPIEDYIAKFAAGRGCAAVGEIAHDAYLRPQAAAQIRALFPNMRILICLREPVEFALSIIGWFMTHTDHYGDSPEEIIGSQRFIDVLDYRSRLEPIFEAFPRDQIKVLFFDDLRDDPQQFISDVFRFLGVDSTYRPKVVDRMVNKTAGPRFKWLTHSAYRLGGLVRSLGFGSFVEEVKHDPLVERLLYERTKRQSDTPILNRSQKALIKARADLPSVEALLQSPLPAKWHTSNSNTEEN